MYHEINDNPRNEWCVSTEEFQQQMEFLKKQNYQTITLDEFYEFRENNETNNTKDKKTLPEKPIIITFDNARLGVYKHAYPILKKLELKACLFVVSDWISDKKNIPENENYSDFMNWEQIKELSENNFQIGSHSKNYDNLTKLPDKELELNLLESKAIIELRINKDITSLSYPGGKLNKETIKAVKKYYKTAVSTDKGTNLIEDNLNTNQEKEIEEKEEEKLFKLKRHMILNNVSLKTFKQLFTTLSLCMITKNEEKFLPECLVSIQNIVDQIIIVDTGSEDKTKKIAESFGAEVYDFKWNNDFSEARNHSLKYAKSDWILFLDADETVSQEECIKIKELINKNKEQGEENPTIAYSLITKTYTNNVSQENFYFNKDNMIESRGFLGASLTKKIRLFKNNQNIYFKGQVNELVEPSIKENKEIVEEKSIFINHYSEKKDLEYKKAKTEKYRELYEKKVLNEPKNPKAYFELAQIYLSQDFFELAKQNLLKALELKQDYTEAFQILGVIYNKLKNYDNALEVLKRAETINKDYAETYFTLGVTYTRLKKIKLAAESIEKGLKLNPNNTNALTNLGAIYEKSGEYDKAIKTIKKSLMINPFNSRAHYNIGLAFMKKNDTNNTIKAFSNAIELGYKDKDKLIRFIENIKNISKLNR